MTATLAPTSAYGQFDAEATLRLQRRLPGPIERVWSYLADGELRRQWLAAGELPAQAGGSLELVWRNDELGDPPGQRPEGFGAEHRMVCRVTALEPPHRLAFTWDGTGEVNIELAPDVDAVLLTLTHQRVVARKARTMVGAGWHMHLDLLGQRLAGAPRAPFWDGWRALHAEYERRVPA